MPLTLVGLLILQGLLFLLWAITIFRWLFALRAEAIARDGTQWPGPRATLRAFRDGLTKPQHAAARRQLLILTLLLLATNIAFALLAPRG